MRNNDQTNSMLHVTEANAISQPGLSGPISSTEIGSEFRFEPRANTRSNETDWQCLNQHRNIFSSLDSCTGGTITLSDHHSANEARPQDFHFMEWDD